VRKYLEKINALVDNKMRVILVYREVDITKSVANMKGKLSLKKLIDLSAFLINAVIKSKQCNGYYGGFTPSRIFEVDSEGFCMFGGEFFSKQTTSK
jgi:hypothetical protein